MTIEVSRRMIILAYHAIADEPSPVTTSLAELRSDLVALQGAGYSFHTLDDCADWLDGKGSIPARSVAVTFDDGYRSVTRSAMPVLVELGVPATVFVIADRLAGDNRWPGQWSSIPAMPLMTAADVREAAAAGLAVGAHGCTHVPLTEVEDDVLRREVYEAGERLEQVSGTEIRHFAYPYGRRGAREMAVVAERYRTAVSATVRLVVPGTSLHDLPRLDAHDIAVARKAHILDPTWLTPYAALRRILRGARRRFPHADS